MDSVQKTLFDFRRVTEDTMELFADQAAAKDLVLVNVIDASVPSNLQGDPARLRQVIAKLLGQALHSTRVGEVVLRVSVLKSEVLSQQLRFEITDTGTAHPPADGSAESLVTTMGGMLVAERISNEGNRWWFDLVLERQQPEVTFVERPDWTGTRGLVVSENRWQRERLSEMLMARGMRASASSDAAPMAAAALNVVLVDRDLNAQVEAEPTLRQVARIQLCSRVADASGCEGTLLRVPFRQSQLYRTVSEKMFAKVRSLTSASSRPSSAHLGATQGRVLIVDDNPLHQTVLKKMLEALGVESDVASGAREALERISKQSFGLVLMNCRLPDVDGFAATKSVRALGGKFEKLPIIAVTANAARGDAEKCLASGMNDYLSKPIDPHELRRLLVKWNTQTTRRAA